MKLLLFLLLFGSGLLNPSPDVVKYMKMFTMMLEGHGSTNNWSTSSCNVAKMVICYKQI